MDKGVIDLIPAAVEAVKLASMNKMELFSSTGKAPYTVEGQSEEANIELVTKIVAQEIAKYLNK